MLSNAYFLAKFRFDTAENEPAKKLQNFRKMHFRKMHFSHARSDEARSLEDGLALGAAPAPGTPPAPSVVQLLVEQIETA